MVSSLFPKIREREGATVSNDNTSEETCTSHQSSGLVRISSRQTVVMRAKSKLWRSVRACHVNIRLGNPHLSQHFLSFLPAETTFY